MYIGAGPNRTIVIPVPPGQVLPDFPAAGLKSPADGMNVTGAWVIQQQPVIAALSASTYLFQKTEIRRNLFRIQVR